MSITEIVPMAPARAVMIGAPAKKRMFRGSSGPPANRSSSRTSARCRTSLRRIVSAQRAIARGVSAGLTPPRDLNQW